MKTGTLLGVVVFGTAVLVVGGLLLKDIIEKNDSQTHQEIDQWVDRRVAESIGQKLETSPSKILQALTEGHNRELLQDIHQLIESARLIFHKSSSLAKVTVIFRVSYKDGTSLSAQIEKDWDDLPSTIRREFLRTNETNITVPWNLPLANTQLT